MQVDFTKRFARQLDRQHDEAVLGKLREVVRAVMEAAAIRDIAGVKKLKGHRTAYRIRLGDYRAGLFIEDGNALFATFEHRRDIYKNFP